MTSKITSVSILTIAVLMSVIVLTGHSSVNATPLSLPSLRVTMEAFNSIEAYFELKLTNVPSGYDVSNRTYLGWCIDSSIDMQRSPATHEVTLYSSLGSKPGNLENQPWNMVNYVLNHKQGSFEDVQEAVWHFINLNGGYAAQGSFAQAMINDAVANGAGFVPNGTQTVAVICYPLVLTGEEKVQITIIEVVVPQEEGSQPSETTLPDSESATPPSEQTPDAQLPDPSPPTDSNPGNEPVSPENSEVDDGWLWSAGIAAVFAVCLVGIFLLFRKWKRAK